MATREAYPLCPLLLVPWARAARVWHGR